MKLQKTRRILIVSILSLTATCGLFVLITHLNKPPKSYDLNGNGTIGLSDISQAMSKVGTECTNCQEDINKDGFVNQTDLDLLNKYIGKRCR